MQQLSMWTGAQQVGHLLQFVCMVHGDVAVCLCCHGMILCDELNTFHFCCRVIESLRASAVQMLQMCVLSLCMIQQPATKRLRCAMSTHPRRVLRCTS